jgi:hypothetical protein
LWDGALKNKRMMKEKDWEDEKVYKREADKRRRGRTR